MASKDEQPKRGGFVSVGDLALDMPDVPVLALRQARHFTRLDQVTQLVAAREAVAELGFMARLLALCSLPRTNPKQRNQYVRRNGPYALYMTAGAGNRLPFGNLPRAPPAAIFHTEFVHELIEAPAEHQLAALRPYRF